MSHTKAFSRWASRLTLLASALALAAAVTAYGPFTQDHHAGLNLAQHVALRQGVADPFEGGVAWLNTGGPIRLAELKGKIVILDFWTYCCINCHHILPNLAKLEEKYKNELVVIGVHTPKFTTEHDTKTVRSKVREYAIKHPVVNDESQAIWRTFGVESWPTLVVLGPDGREIARNSGEIGFESLDAFMKKVLTRFEGEIDRTPLKFFPENEKPDDTPLLFPGKVLADATGQRLFVADTGHNRIVITDLNGKSPVVIGSGTAGLADGTFSRAEFHRPQGMALLGDVLYVADTESHAIRAVDLGSKTVSTVAGTGAQAMRDPSDYSLSPAKTTPLNSPWDLAHVPGSKALYIAMAGPHQLWRMNLETGEVGVFAGTGRENIVDGPLADANFAQPSGLATDGSTLYVADSEVSALRAVSLDKPHNTVKSIVGEGLFEFGDVDGRGTRVRLQHCLGVAFADGKLYVADTYNNKVKVCDPKTRAVKTLVGSHEPGETDDPPAFYQPGGLSVAGNRLYVADSNNHKVRVIDLATDAVSTLTPEGLTPPRPPARTPSFPNATKATLDPVQVGPVQELALNVEIPLQEGFILNDQGSLPTLVQSPDKPELIAGDLGKTGTRIEPPASPFTLKVPLTRPLTAGESFELRLSFASFVCNKGSGLCTIKSYLWTVPITVAADAPATLDLRAKN